MPNVMLLSSSENVWPLVTLITLTVILVDITIALVSFHLLSVFFFLYSPDLNLLRMQVDRQGSQTGTTILFRVQYIRTVISACKQ